MQIHISRHGNVLGMFSLEELEMRVTQRRVLPTDDAWMPDMEDWKPLAEIVDIEWPPEESAASIRQTLSASARPKLMFGASGAR